MELLTVNQLAYKLNLSIKGVYTRIYTNSIKPTSKKGRVNLFLLNQFINTTDVITETFYIYESKLNLL